MIYLDYNATTPVLPDVLEAMMPYFTTEWGNPSSTYKFGYKIKSAIEKARERVAELIGAHPMEVIFTSCATEGNNAAIHAALKANPSKRHIVTSAVEHSSVLNDCKALEKDGFRVTYLPVDREGLLKVADLENAITDDTAIVSLMWANNETGVLFPVKEIAEICQSRGVLYHCDAVQAAGKLDINLRNTSVITQNRPTGEAFETLTAQRSLLGSRAMSNVLNEEKQQQVIVLGQLGWSLRRIEQQTGVRRETASAYLKAAGIAVRGPGRWGRGTRLPTHAPSTDSTAAKPANEVTTDSRGQTPENPQPHPSNASTSASACEPYREAIESWLDRGRNAMAIWQDLVDQHGYGGGYQTVKRFVRKLRGTRSPQAVGIILTAPGEEAQVDYGTGPMVRDEKSGKYRRTRLFVMTLGYSRKSVRLLVFRSSSQTWAELHEKAFRRLGGTARVVVLDNLREGVLKADLYDPTLNPLYHDVLSHYGVTAMPCRVRDPDRKGKVESGVGHAQETPLKGQRFESLEEAQAYLDHWEQRWADTRIHGTTKRQVAVMFGEEKPFLQTLPIEPFRYYQYGERVVHLDGCVEVERAYYGLPPGWIGRVVKIQWDALHVRILDPSNYQLLREHLRQFPGNYRINEEDRSHKTPLSTVHLLARAAKAGTHIGQLCEAIFRNEAELGIRRILGVVALAKKYGVVAVDDACAAALDLGVENYRFVRRYLERHPQLSLRHVDPLIRELSEYRDLINLRTKDNEKEQENESD